MELALTLLMLFILLTGNSRQRNEQPTVMIVTESPIPLKQRLAEIFIIVLILLIGVGQVGK